MKSLCVITLKLNTLTDDIPNDGGWSICLRMLKPVKEVALKILNNGRVYITKSVIIGGFSRGPGRPRYNGVAVYSIYSTYFFFKLWILTIKLMFFVGSEVL